MINLGKYSKAIAAIIGAGLTWGAATYGNTNHWVTLATAIVTVLGVYGVPNSPTMVKPPQ